MLYELTLHIAIFVCLAGLGIRLSLWFIRRVGPPQEWYSASPENAQRRFRKIPSSSLSSRIRKGMYTLTAGLFFQSPLLKTGFHRWLAHILIFYGFILLLLMHAFDQTITASIFPGYASTLNPFLFLRNLFGVFVLTGIAIFLVDRLLRRRNFAGTNRADAFALALLALIVISGFLLEGVQIFSEPIFDQMVIDYMGSDDPEELEPLKAYWETHYAVVFSPPPAAADLETGRMLHTDYCMYCHSKPENAFVSFSIASALRGGAEWFNRNRADIWLWRLHFLACFAALACLPFTKFFHILSVPLNWLIQAIFQEGHQPSDSGHALGMDACTHCGVCTQHCSVAPVFQMLGNAYILPSEKLAGVKKMSAYRGTSAEELKAIAEGSYICTECYRCTELCPSGIRLHELWNKSRDLLAQKGYPDIPQYIRSRPADEWSRLFANDADVCQHGAPLHSLRQTISAPETYVACVQCSICSNVCPVVAADDTIAPPDTTPQQVMNLLRLDLMPLALGSGMVWDCTTCYLCQEHCPQSIPITDILYELRNIVARRLNKTDQAVQDPAGEVPNGRKAAS